MSKSFSRITIFFVLLFFFFVRIISSSAQNARTSPFKPEGGPKAGSYTLASEAELSWNTFLGGSGGEEGYSAALDRIGNVYVAGYGEGTWGSPVNPHSGDFDAFVAKLNRSGALQWNTFLGSSSYEEARGIVLDASGNIYVAGIGMASWGAPVNPHSGNEDAFVAKLNESGVLQWNTFLGTSENEGGLAIALDASGNVLVAGYSAASWGSPIIPHSGGADAFVAKLNNSGVLQWNTFLGSSSGDESRALATDTSGNAYVAGLSFATWGSPVNPYAGGQEAFAAKLNGSGTLQWNTFLGSSGNDNGHAIATDTSGNVYMAGLSTATWGSPVNPYAGGQDAFIVNLNGSGTLQWSTFLGSSANDNARGIDLDASGNLYIAGTSLATWGSPIYPYSGSYEAFSAKLNGSGFLQWNAFLGSSADDVGYAITVDPSGNVCVEGMSGANWGSPLIPYAGGGDAFIAKIVEKDDFIGTWDGQGVYFRNSSTGSWVNVASPADLIAAGELDGDGRDDLIGIWPGQGGVWVRYSKTGAWVQISSVASHIGSGDMNGDGREDFLGTWDGQGVYYRNSISGVWVKLASPATLITAGDVDGDGKDDLIGIWPTQGGVWVKYSETGAWAKLASTAIDIAAGDMNGDGRDDLLATWDGQGVYYRDSITGSWVKMATTADQVTCGDIDGDGTEDLIGIWAGQGGVWVKYSETGNWERLSSTAKDIAAGLMRGAVWGSGRFGFVPLDMPVGGFAEGPSAGSGNLDLSAEGPGGWRFAAQEEKNLVPLARELARLSQAGPGEPGFRWMDQGNLVPRETIEPKQIKGDIKRPPRK
jgi:hypothetical protein